MTDSGNNLTEKFSIYSCSGYTIYFDLREIKLVEVMWSDDNKDITGVVVTISNERFHFTEETNALEVGKQILSDFKRVVLKDA